MKEAARFDIVVHRMKVVIFQFIRFGIVGAGNTVLDALIYISLTRFFHLHYLLAAAIAFLIAGLNSFVWNKHWTFRDAVSYSHIQLVRFYVAAGVAFIMNEGVLWIVVSSGVYDIIGKLIASFSAGGVNFLLQKFWTFSSRATHTKHPIVQTKQKQYNKNK